MAGDGKEGGELLIQKLSRRRKHEKSDSNLLFALRVGFSGEC